MNSQHEKVVYANTGSTLPGQETNDRPPRGRA